MSEGLELTTTQWVLFVVWAGLLWLFLLYMCIDEWRHGGK